MGPPKFGAPGNCPICPPLKPALYVGVCIIVYNSVLIITLIVMVYNDYFELF